MAKKKAVKKKAVKKKVATSSLSAKLEKTIEKDFQACEELLRSGEGRNEWIEKNCKRLAAWQEAAEAGDARGQVLYGCCFYYGHGVKENDKKAVECFSKSAEQGNAQGQFSLGQCYFYGHGVEENDKKAVEWFNKSAEQGNAQGQFSLGKCFDGGFGVKEDDKKAVEWFSKSAKQGCEDAVHSLGQAWRHNPDLIDKSDLPFIRKQARNGTPSALTLLGCLHLLGDCISKNAKKGEELIRKGNGVLTSEVAVEWLVDEDSQNLNSFALLDADAAHVLARVGGPLELNGLVQISSEVADTLSSSDRWLKLNGITHLDEDSAKALANCDHISLDSLRGLSPESAGYFLKHKHLAVIEGMPNITSELVRLLVDSTDELVLDLRRLSSIDKATAEALLNGPDELSLGGITSLSPAIASILAIGRQELALDGLRTMSKNLAASLVSSSLRSISLNGLSRLSSDAAQVLSDFDGTLSLDGLPTVSKSVAASLAKSSVEHLSLDGLTSLSVHTARIMSAFGGTLWMNNLAHIDVKTTAALTSDVRIEDLSLTGLHSVSEEALMQLSGFGGRLVLSDILQDQVEKQQSTATTTTTVDWKTGQPQLLPERGQSLRLDCCEPTESELRSLTSGGFRYIKLLDVSKQHANLLTEITRNTSLEHLTITSSFTKKMEREVLALPEGLVSSLNTLKSLRDISFDFQGCSDDIITAISDLPQLSSCLCSVGRSGCDLSPILGMASLKEIGIEAWPPGSTPCDGIFCGYTGAHRLWNLSMSGIAFSDEEMEPFAQLSGLSSLKVSHNPILKGDGFEFLGRSVKELSVRACGELRDVAIINVAANCKLKEMWLNECPRLTDASLEALLHVPSLRFLELDVSKGRKGRFSQTAINRLRRNKVQVRVIE